ncbi:MAG: uroporphyrinogen decarboxylase family protein [Clostridia bacterium]|nr:uroporphyrinogen decarboxylase family protein [Clostridia bacterium]
MNGVISNMMKTRGKMALPILSFPSVDFLATSVNELCHDSEKQAEGMRLVAGRCDAMASVSYMDLSVEAECFGSEIMFTEHEVPSVIGKIISCKEDAEALAVPKVGAARSGIYVEAIKKAKESITDRPVLAGMIGPLSLAARLYDVTDIMIAIFEDPDTVSTVLDKATEFLIEYGRAFREAGADGVVIAEPVAGLFDPFSCADFSSNYIKKIVDALQNDSFAVVYHNCGGSVVACLDSIVSTGCAAYHFGNAVDITEILSTVSPDTVVMGNIDPVGVLKSGTPDDVYAKTYALVEKCASYGNFIISTGCDVPPATPWENIDKFFLAVSDFYEGK